MLGWCQEIWRRIRLEFTIELPLLRDRWKLILFGACFQYVHGMATQLAHRVHQPMRYPLHDIGFAVLPELGQKQEWVSELIFGSLFISFMIWSFSPFVTEKKRFYTCVLFARLLMVLVVCQTLRILSFSSTQLPGPNYHCRLPEVTAVRPMPLSWWGHLVVDVAKGTTHGCGDLIFSSHTTFALVGILTYTEYGGLLITKAIAWLMVATLSVLIVASRKHYTVDVVIAWYVVPLVFYAMHKRWTTKRPLKDEWPHRPLITDVGLQQVVVDDGVALAEAPKGPLLPVSQMPRSSSGKLTNGKAPQLVPLPVGKGQGNGGPGTPPGREEDQHGSANGSSRKGPSAIMRPRSTQTIVAAEAVRDEETDDWDNWQHKGDKPVNSTSSANLAPTAPGLCIIA